jgi:hypothetical protein
MVVGLVGLVVGTLAARAATSAPCPAGKKPAQFPQAERAQFNPHDKSFRLAFDGSGQPQSDFLAFNTWQKTPRHPWAELQEPLASAQEHKIGQGVTLAVKVMHRAIGSYPALVRVCIAVDPDAVPNLHPGRYEGKVFLTAENVEDEPIPTVVTVRASRSKPVLLAFGGVVIGIVVRILTELASGQRPGNPGGSQALRNYLLQWGFPLTIFLGVLTCWRGYSEIYADNPTWGASGADSLKLFGTCFGLQVGSIGGADIAKRLMS